MKKQIYALAVLFASLLLVACEGDDGIDGLDGTDGTDGFNSLVATREIPKGDADCLGGGTAIDSGLDTNRNDILDPEEVTATEILECLVAPMIRALHASPDAPTVNVLVDGEEALSGVDYTEGSGFVPLADTWFTVMVEANLPGDETAVVFDWESWLDYNEEFTLIATGYLADNAGEPEWMWIWNYSDERITPDFFRVQIAHAAPSAPPVDVYVTAFDAELGNEAPVTGTDTPLVYLDYTWQPLEVLAGDYRIRITPAGDAETVVFDSGETPLTFAAGADLLIVAVDNVGPGETPVQLVVMDDAAAFTLYDIDTPASVVAAHMSPDAPNVDLLADVVGTEEDEALPLVRDVGYNEFCDLAVPAPGVYTVSVVDTGNNATVAHTIPVDVMKGDEAISIVSGFLADGVTPDITDITLVSDTRSVFTEGKLRITHASPSTGAVDLYFVPDGTLIADVDPTFAAVPFGGDTTQLSIAPDVYDIYVTAAGSKDPVFEEQDATFDGGEVLDAIARDPLEGEVGPQVTVLDYTAAEGEEGYVAPCPIPVE
jgi:hypothetical protein